MSTPAPRPGSVTLIVALTWLSAIGAIISGILLLTISETALADAELEKSTATIYGVTELVLGVVIALVALGLGKGSSVSRMLVSILMVVRIAVGFFAMFTLPNGIITGVISVAIAVIVLILLWNEKANAFFATN